MKGAQNLLIPARSHGPQRLLRFAGGMDGAPPPGQVADELGKLAGLRDQGVLTEQEFLDQKATLLR